jgi:hypothetical protein
MHDLDSSRPIDRRSARAAARASRGSRKRAIIVGCGAALLFGTWALIANRAHPAAEMARAAFTQGILSFTSTTCAVLLLEYLYRLGSTPARKLLLAVTGTPAVVFVTMAGVHALAGTPNIAITLLPSFVSGTIFFVTYALNLRRLELVPVAAEHAASWTR